MKNKMSRELDQFYTRSHTAQHVIETIQREVGSFSKFSFFLEPSAGKGALYRHLPRKKRLGIEIEPSKSFIERDFLSITDDEWKEMIPYEKNEVLVVGNPPFGKNGSTARKFLNRLADLSETICLILPSSFAKYTMKNKVHPNLHLSYSESLPSNSFTFDGEVYDVSTVLQIWIWKNEKREKKVPRKTHPDFEFLSPSKRKQMGDMKDVILVQRIGARAGQVMPPDSDKTSSNYHYLLPHVSNLRKRLLDLDLENAEYKYLTAGYPSIGQTELIEIYSLKWD